MNWRELFRYDGLIPVVEALAADLDAYIPQPFADEIRGISEAMEISLGVIVLANVVYDMSAYGDGGSKYVSLQL